MASSDEVDGEQFFPVLNRHFLIGHVVNSGHGKYPTQPGST